jgi:hypothetical protein
VGGSLQVLPVLLLSGAGAAPSWSVVPLLS